MAAFKSSDWIFEPVATRKHRSSDGTEESARGYIRVKLRSVPSCRCVVANLQSLKWDWERSETKTAYTTYKLRAEQRGGDVWAVGQCVTGGGGKEQSEPVAKRIGPWPKIAAAGREG